MRTLLLPLLLLVVACSDGDPVPPTVSPTPTAEPPPSPPAGTALTLLGTVQDAGSPHIACRRACCRPGFGTTPPDRRVVSLGLYDAATERRFLFEATPDIARQARALRDFGGDPERELPDGIFLTHAHIGHYTGLMYLGKEATNAAGVPVYAMPRLRDFLTNNGPWSQLVADGNVALRPLREGEAVTLSADLSVVPLRVPHRDEYSETVGYRIEGPRRSALFLPDIDKWERWERDIVAELHRVDYAFLDATFYDGTEINTRDLSQIPHPFVVESLDRFAELPAEERRKVVFVHFNHTNPLLDPASAAARRVRAAGFRIGRRGEVFEL